MGDQPQERAGHVGEASASKPSTCRRELDQRSADPAPATDPPPTRAEQAQIIQDEALASGEENVV
jgi:hypothetical protein